MAVQAINVAVPSNGTIVPAVDSDGDAMSGDEQAVRNTGTVVVLVGGASSCIFPLMPGQSGAGEFIGLSLGPQDTLYVCVQNAGVAGQITMLKTK